MNQLNMKIGFRKKRKKGPPGERYDTMVDASSCKLHNAADASLNFQAIRGDNTWKILITICT